MGWWKNLTAANSNRSRNDGSYPQQQQQQQQQRPDYMVPDVDASSHQQNTIGGTTQQTGFQTTATGAAIDQSTKNIRQPRTQQQYQNDEDDNSIKSVTCWQRFWSEINPCNSRRSSKRPNENDENGSSNNNNNNKKTKNSWFHVKDPVNGRIIDVPESFAPNASWGVVLYKLFYCTICIGTLVYTIIVYDYNDDQNQTGFYFAFLTNWGTIFCCGYAVLSLINTVVLASRTGQPDPDGTVSCRIRTTWILFAVSAQTTFVTMLLFWPLIFDTSVHLNFETVAPHGLLFLLTIIDGMYVNRIPLRLMHWFGFILPFDVAYIIWTVLQSFLHIKNPSMDSDPTTNDDAIYAGILEWSNNWTTALFWSVMTIFVIGPILYILLWTISFGYCCCLKCSKTDPRRYVDSVDPYDTRPTVDDVEEGSIFAGWK